MPGRGVLTGRRDAGEPLLTRAEVAAIFRVHPKTVARWTHAGKLAQVRTAAGHRGYRASMIRALIYGAADNGVGDRDGRW